MKPHPKLDPEDAGGFSELIPESFVDLLLDPPAEWGIPDSRATVAPPSAESLRASKAKRSRSLARYPWSRPDQPYRVHFYDKTKRGTWHQYFDKLEDAKAFAVDKPLWGEDAVVETKKP